MVSLLSLSSDVRGVRTNRIGSGPPNPKGEPVWPGRVWLKFWDRFADCFGELYQILLSLNRGGHQLV